MEEYLALLKSFALVKIAKIAKSEIVIQLEFQAKPGSKLSFIKIKDDQIIIAVTAKPIDGEANDAFIKALADAFHLTKSDVEIIRGLKGKNKTAQLTIGESNSRPWKKRIEDLRGLLCRLN